MEKRFNKGRWELPRCNIPFLRLSECGVLRGYRFPGLSHIGYIPRYSIGGEIEYRRRWTSCQRVNIKCHMRYPLGAITKRPRLLDVSISPSTKYFGHVYTRLPPYIWLVGKSIIPNGSPCRILYVRVPASAVFWVIGSPAGEILGYRPQYSRGGEIY